VGLAVLLFWALALPIVYMSRSDAVQADESNDPLADRSVATPAVAPAIIEPAVEFLPLPTASEKRIAAEMDQPTVIDFQESPLQHVVNYLKDHHAIEIQLDDKALADAGIDPETQLTKSLKGISLRSALHLLLAPLELTTVIEDEVLLITTREKASTLLVTRTYPVGDLVENDKYADLINALTDTVKPLTWEEGGGEGHVAPVKTSKSLAILQTQEAHGEVLQLLRSLRAARKLSK
jgi:hypothetical protein